VLEKTEARALAEGGDRPAPADVLLVRLFPGRSKDLSVTLNVDFAERGLEELEFP
jgi:hypothetical protein